SRTISADQFFVGMLTSALAIGEILTEVRFPVFDGHVGGAYSKHAHPASRYAVVGVAATVELDASNTVRGARVAITGLGYTASVASLTSHALVGTRADDSAIATAAALVTDGIEPREDGQGDASYKTHLAQVHAERAIKQAVARARA
ncbi:MAG TPA: hypothetical protein VIP11_14645, partial [Gemmatimonadaceae bacterium]